MRIRMTLFLGGLPHLSARVALTVSLKCLFSDEMNNGIKKEVVGKDPARIWISDDIKMQNFSHPLVSGAAEYLIE